jgi:hypothetical protein
MGPYIFLTIFLSDILSAFISSMVTVQVSDPYLNNGLIKVLYIFNLLFRDRNFDLKSLIYAEYVEFALLIVE